MKRRGDESKEESKGCKHSFYGMNGVGKQTNSILCSIKCGVIQRAVDGKGIGRRVIWNPSTKSSKEKGRSSPNLLNDLVNCRITLGGAQGLVSQILKWGLQTSGEDIGFSSRK